VGADLAGAAIDTTTATAEFVFDILLHSMSLSAN
jgi:hypothetical protein